MRYYWNGQPVSSTEAFRRVIAAHQAGGNGDNQEIMNIWSMAAHDEEARDTLATVSGYRLEILTDEEDEALED